MKFCPFCERVRHVLNFYEIDYDTILINLTDKPEWYMEMAPNGKVPMIMKDGQKLFESDFIIRFLDDSNGGKLSQVEEQFDLAAHIWKQIFPALHSILWKVDGLNNENKNNFQKGITELENSIEGPFLFGDRLTLADIMLFPILSRWECVIRRLDYFSHTSQGIAVQGDVSSWPKVVAYRSKMCSLEFISKSLISLDIMEKYNSRYLKNQPDYDVS